MKRLRRYTVQVAEIPTWGVEVLPLDVAACLRAGEARTRHGLLTNDSIVVGDDGGCGD